MRRLNHLLRTSPLAALLSRRSELHPERALVTPVWLAALVVLALNDHLLKGSGLLPGAITGKLSDFAGMIVAPVLLAAVLRVRTRRGLALCCAAVGAVFAGINVSPAIADAWSWLMSFAIPWHITVDPTDLVALPALALGWRALVPAMTRPLPALPGWLPQTAQASAIAVGGFLCMATSEGGPPPDDWPPPQEEVGTTDPDDYMDIQVDVYLNNATAGDIRVRTRPLRSDVLFDCLAVEEDPGLLLSESLFGEGQTVLLPPSTNVGVRDIGLTRNCYAVRVEGDAFAAPFVLFWRADDIPTTLIDGDIDDPSLHTIGAVLLGLDADQRVVVQDAHRPVVFDVVETIPADAFVPGSDEERLVWSDPPYGDHQLTSVELSPDGCVVARVDGDVSNWYLCVPGGAFPFAAGEWIQVADSAGALDIRRIPDPQAPIAVSEAVLSLSRGAALPNITDLVLAGKPDFSVPIAPEPVCGTVSRPDDITARFEDGEVVHLLPGESTTLAGAGRSLTLWVAHAEDRVVLDSECAEGPDGLGQDIEVAALVVADEP